MTAPDRAKTEAPKPSSIAHRFGAPAGAGVSRRENIRATAPGRRGAAGLDTSRGRIVLLAVGFTVCFAALVVKLALATIVMPVEPKPVAVVRHPEPLPPTLIGGTVNAAPPISPQDFGLKAQRATITDRRGEPLAISLPLADLIADPKVVYDIDQVVAKLRAVLPRLDAAETRRQLTKTDKRFVYLARRITPRDMLAINTLGIPGVDFQRTEQRRYPLGTVAAQVLGGVDIDGKGVAGIEKYFNDQLLASPEPLKLSIDIRVQAVMRDELLKAVTDFTALGGCGIMMDVRTGEILAMVNLPDFNNNDFGRATAEQRFNRATFGLYEPGSTFKLQTAAMALDAGTAHLWNVFDASGPIHIGRFTINDFEGKRRPLYFPEVIAYSSNIGAAKIAQTVGAERQRAWHMKLGMLSRIPLELPEVRRPMAPPAANWKEISTLTIAFGHGISVTPLHVVRGTSAVANHGVLVKPTLLALSPDAPIPPGEQVMRPEVSDIMRKLMRLVVSDGFGKPAEVPGYYVGGKTGTAEKAGPGGYKKNVNIQAFTSVFPMNAPRYAVYMMLDEAHANAKTFGYATAGWVIAPAVGRVISRVAPMLGMLPEVENDAAIKAALAIPLQPTHGYAATVASTATKPLVQPAAKPGPRLTAPPLRREVKAVMPALGDNLVRP